MQPRPMFGGSTATQLSVFAAACLLLLLAPKLGAAAQDSLAPAERTRTISHCRRTYGFHCNVPCSAIPNCQVCHREKYWYHRPHSTEKAVVASTDEVTTQTFRYVYKCDLCMPGYKLAADKRSCVATVTAADPFAPPPRRDMPEYGTLLKNEVMYVNSATRFVACDEDSLTVTSPQAASIKVGSVLLGTLASFNPNNATDPCSWIVRKVTAITPAGTNTKLSTVAATLVDIVSKVNATISDTAGTRRQAAGAIAPAARDKLIEFLKPDWEKTLTTGVKISPIFEFKPDSELSLQKDEEDDIVGIYVSLTGELSLGLQLSVNAELTSKLSWEVDLMKDVPALFTAKPLPCIPGAPVACHFRIEFAASVSASLKAAAKVSATYEPRLTASTGVITGYHKDKGLYLDKVPFKLTDTSKPFQISAGCSLEASAELAVGPKLIIGVGPSLLAKFTTKTDLLSVTVPRYTLSFEAGANIQSSEGYPKDCSMCNSACPRIGTKGEVKHALGAQIATEGLVTTAAKALDWKTELPIELVKADYGAEQCRDMSLLALQKACCLQVTNDVEGCKAPVDELVAVDDEDECLSCQSLRVSVLANDKTTGAPNHGVVLVSPTTALGGSVSIAPGREVLYTPPASIAPGSCYIDTFEYFIRADSADPKSKASKTATAAIMLRPADAAQLDNSYSIIAPKAGESCEAACTRASSLTVNTEFSCRMRPINGGKAGNAACLVETQATGSLQWVAGSVGSADPVQCKVAVSDAVKAPLASAAQRCMCTPCQGDHCDSYFWKATASSSCPAVPAVPGSKSPVFWGRWCRSTIADIEASAGKVAYGSVGFEAGGTCYTSSGAAKGTEQYNVWCPAAAQCKGTPSDAIPNGAWPAGGCDGLQECRGKCNMGFTGSPYATCDSLKGGWGKVTGVCTSSGSDPCATAPCGRGGDCFLAPDVVAGYDCKCRGSWTRCLTPKPYCSWSAVCGRLMPPCCKTTCDNCGKGSENTCEYTPCCCDERCEGPDATC